MLEAANAHVFIVFIFFIGYAAIVFEHTLNVNKSASALVMAVLTWMLLFLAKGDSLATYTESLSHHLSDISQIIFFLLAAMTIVELIDSHKGFHIITDLIRTNSKKKILWITGCASFFLSALIDNLTTTIVMVTLLRRLVPEHRDRLLLGSAVVIAANLGGAWSPIGDVTTTMLWIRGYISPMATIRSLFLPCLFSLLPALWLVGRSMRGKIPQLTERSQESLEPGARFIFFLSLIGFIMVPIFKAITGLPPFMSMLILLGILWIITDLIHHDYEHRQHLLLHHVLTRIDVSGILFFFGILLCIGSLDTIGVLKSFSLWLNEIANHQIGVIALIIGLISAVVDNVPLIAATMSMYDLTLFPADSSLWQLIAYAGGTGGSLLVVGSAAGVALMSLEKVNFFWYCKHISWIALVSYLSGFALYLLF